MRAAGFVALCALGLGIVVEGGFLLDVPFGFDRLGDLWNQGAASSVGEASLAAGIGLLAIMTVRRVAAAIGVALVIVSFVLSGHAATADPRWLAIPTVILHVAIAAFWIGSFVPLVKALGRGEAVGTVRRFSQLAIVLVPQLLVAGAILGLLQVQALPAVFDTDYGLALFRKVVLVAILLALAAFNRMVLTPRLAAGQPRAKTHLRLAIFGELLIGGLILVCTAYLSETVPPRSLAGHNHATSVLARLSGAYNVAETAAGERALVQVTPGRSGFNTLKVHLLDKDGQPMAPKEVTAELSEPTLGIEPIQRKLDPQGDGYFEHSGVDFAAPGEWTVRVRALIDDFDLLTLETRITIR
jgi:copper transport protein